MADEDDPFPIMYKYRSLSGDRGREAAEDIILHGRMWWQVTTDFNDPFDCNPVVTLRANAAEMKAFARRAARSNMPSTPRGQRRKRARDIAAIPIAEHEERMRSNFLEWMAETAVTCFSEVNCSVLMWAHYADSHRGVCFIFKQDVERHFVAFPVTYSADRLPVNTAAMDRDDDNFERAVLHKAIEWKYERELRLVHYRGGRGYRPFPATALVGVIYGCRISDADREFLDGLLARRPHLKRYQAKLDSEKFSINVEAVRP